MGYPAWQFTAGLLDDFYFPSLFYEHSRFIEHFTPLEKNLCIPINYLSMKEIILTIPSPLVFTLSKGQYEIFLFTNKIQRHGVY